LGFLTSPQPAPLNAGAAGVAFLPDYFPAIDFSPQKRPYFIDILN
jgi:hypothetical protein